MSKQSDQVAMGFMRLSASERQDVATKINEFINASETGKRQLSERFRVQAGLDLGPTNQGGCQCCGK